MFFFYFNITIGQVQYYKNFTIENGLPSNKIYNIIEDKEGFIWVCTNQGVSRFDGINFVNFTTKNGLSDNEIITMFEDYKGRIWFNSFSGVPSYYQNGKIYNFQNDSFLKRIKKFKPNGPCMSIIIKKNNSIAFYIIENNKKLIISKDNKEIQIYDTEYLRGFSEQKIYYNINDSNFILSPFEIISWKNSDSIIQSKYQKWFKNVFYYSTFNSEYIYGIKNYSNTVCQLNTKNNKTKYFSINSKYDNMFVMNGKIMLTGKKCYNILDDNFNVVTENQNVAFSFERAYIDKKGNKWFGSFDNGLYLIRNQAPEELPLPDLNKKGILGIEYAENYGLLIKTEKNGLMLIDSNNKYNSIFNHKNMGRVLGVAISHPNYIIGTDGGLFKIDIKKKTSKLIVSSSIKNIKQISKNKILIGDHSKSFLYYPNLNDSIFILDKGRTTAVCYINDSLYFIGGLKGIKQCIIKKSVPIVSILNLNEEINNSRIVDIKKDYLGNIWIVTGLNGVFIYTKEKKLYKISKNNKSLLPNVCLQIEIEKNNRIWLATSEGISIIEYNFNFDFTVKNFSICNGIPSKSINGITFKEKELHIATQNGIYKYLTELKTINEVSNVIITQISVNNINIDITNYNFNHNQNNIIISFTSSFINSNIDYKFRYRISEINSNWNETNLNQIPLLGLTPGEYTFEIASINLNDEVGKITVYKFLIHKPWYNQFWFIILVSIFILSILFYFLNLIKDRYNLKSNLTTLKLRILRAQMNPHFVFNALNNLQHIVQLKEFERAENYIGKLSLVLRKSIDYSTKEFIELKKELEYTQNYLEIEKMRFNDRFNYYIEVNENVTDLSFLFVPPLIIQPLVENSIKHAFKNSNIKGEIKITINQVNEDFIEYIIIDNGSGFEINYNEKIDHGLNITKNRIEILYKSLKLTCSFEVNSNKNGTKIIIRLPILKD